MKKISFLLVFMLTASMTYAQSLFEKYERFLVAPNTYECYRTERNLHIDGKLDESSWSKAKETAPFVDISGKGFATPKFKTTAKMLWDDEYLYIGAVLEEDNIIAHLSQRDTIIYYDNDFEVFIDPDNDGMNYFEIETNAKGVVFDLMLDKAYRSQGKFLLQWDCPGLKLATHREGTLNNPNDKDQYWSVEMAIPYKAITTDFKNPLKAGQTWRINFSRVEWLKKGGPEENWVWSATGAINMHMPDRWGYLCFSDETVGSDKHNFTYPCDQNIYKLMWALFYAQQDYYAKNNEYIRSESGFQLTNQEKSALPEGAKLSVEGTKHSFDISVTLPQKKQIYTLNENGRFGVTDTDKEKVKQ